MQEHHVVLGAGQVGTVIARELLARGKRVRQIRRTAGQGRSGIECISGDLSDLSFAEQATRQGDFKRALDALARLQKVVAGAWDGSSAAERAATPCRVMRSIRKSTRAILPARAGGGGRAPRRVT